MSSLYKTRISKTEKRVWFCGCVIEVWGGGGGDKDFDDVSVHEKYFDRENFRNVYICHKSKIVNTEYYDTDFRRKDCQA
jgi:hypothetical protein